MCSCKNGKNKSKTFNFYIFFLVCVVIYFSKYYIIILSNKYYAIHKKKQANVKHTGFQFCFEPLYKFKRK
jgi:hypothetical protein